MRSFTTLYASLTGFRVLVKANRVGCDSEFARIVHDNLIDQLDHAIALIGQINRARRQRWDNTDPSDNDDLAFDLYSAEQSFINEFYECGRIPLVDHLEIDEATGEWFDRETQQWYFKCDMPELVDVSDDMLCGLRRIITAISAETDIRFSAYVVRHHQPELATA